LATGAMPAAKRLTTTTQERHVPVISTSESV
jgi:hypothetical protein